MSSMRPPEVDRVAASRSAVEARRARADIKRRIAEGSLDPLEVLTRADAGGPRSAAATLRLPEFLRSIPGIGVVRAGRLLDELEIAPSKRVGGLGVRQRRRLEEALRARARAAGTARGRLLVLAGPTAVGKGAVSGYIRHEHPEVLFSVSATTRPPRPGEVHGEHYYFVDDVEFDRMLERGDFLEHATVHNAYRYGTPRPPVDEALAAGRNVLLEIDLQGARSVRAAMPESYLVFLLPPSWEELVRRLVGRGTESAEEQSRRLETAKEELGAQDEFDARVINDEVSRAAQEVVELLSAPASDRDSGAPRTLQEEP